MKLYRKITDSNNFFIIEQNEVTFWGLDIRPKTIILSKELSRLINKLQLPKDEVIEIADDDSCQFYIKAYGSRKNKQTGCVHVQEIIRGIKKRRRHFFNNFNSRA